MPIVEPATPEAIAKAARFLQQGGLVAFPTETVYGIGADALNDLAVAAIFSVKGRPTFNPLIAHIPNLAVAERFAVIDDRARLLARHFWPGPLTMVLKAATGSYISELATSGLDTIALRCPAHPVALALISQAGRPIVAPSANRSGRVSPTAADHVATDFADFPELLILDSGPTEVGLESTIVDITGPEVSILRSGVVTADELAAVLGGPVGMAAHPADPARPTAPGQLASHYAPRATVRLNADAAMAGEALLAFGPVTSPSGSATINLSDRGDLIEAAARLYGSLRQLDASGVASIAVMPIPDVGIGRAINDRLRRAAAPRPPLNE